MPCAERRRKPRFVTAFAQSCFTTDGTSSRALIEELEGRRNPGALRRRVPEDFSSLGYYESSTKKSFETFPAVYRIQPVIPLVLYTPEHR